MYSVIDFICIFSGAYLAYAGIVMKTQGKIISNVVMGKGMGENAIRDKEGFINYLYWKLALAGGIIIVAGIFDLLNSLMGGDGIVSSIVAIIFWVVLIFYGVVTNKALKKFTR